MVQDRLGDGAPASRPRGFGRLLPLGRASRPPADIDPAEKATSRRVAVARVALGIGLLVLWELLTLGPVDPFWVSSPLRIGARLVEWLRADLLHHLEITLRETFVGYTGGVFFGVLTGLILARLEFLGRVLDPFIMALNGIPRIALAPMFIIWFGIGETSKMALASILTFFLCFYATLSGLRSVEKSYIDVARIMGASARQIFFKVELRSASPWIITAMKVSLPFALVGAIVGEFIAATGGLGYKIQLFTSQFDTTGAVTGIIVLMFVVITFNSLLTRMEAHIMRWKPKTSSASIQSEG